MKKKIVAKELYHKYRPRRFKDVLGQPEFVNSIGTLIRKKKFPHACLITGPPGCGKTTSARIIAKELNCGESDCHEINCADFRGIDTVRNIRERMPLAPLGGDTRFWIIDEAHQQAKQSQEAFLKILEDQPPWVYLTLCTTEPSKLIPALKSRCTEFKVKLLNDEVLTNLVLKVMLKEGKRRNLTNDVLDKLIEVSAGSARKALVLLHQVIDMKDEEQQIEIIQNSDAEKEGIEVARAIFKYGVQWKEVATILKNVNQEPETIRRIVLGYANTILLSGGKLANRARLVIDCFSSNYYDTGAAGLTWSCDQVINLSKK